MTCIDFAQRAISCKITCHKKYCDIVQNHIFEILTVAPSKSIKQSPTSFLISIGSVDGIAPYGVSEPSGDQHPLRINAGHSREILLKTLKYIPEVNIDPFQCVSDGMH